MRRRKHDCSEVSHLQGWNKLLTYSEIIILPQMTCWATCCLSQRELVILHVHHICASVCLVRMECSWCVCNEGRGTPVYIRFSVDNCHHDLLPDADCKWLKHLITVALNTICGQCHLENTRFSLSQLSLVIFRSMCLGMPVLSQLITTELLCMRALLHICPQNPTQRTEF